MTHPKLKIMPSKRGATAPRTTRSIILELTKEILKTDHSISMYKLRRLLEISLGLKLNMGYIVTDLQGSDYLIDCKTWTVWKT